MVIHYLVLNESKTEAVVIPAVHNHKRVQPSVDLIIDVCGCSVTQKPCIREIDDAMSMAVQIPLPGGILSHSHISTTACNAIVHV